MLVCAALALPASAHGADWAGEAQNVTPAGADASDPLGVAISPGKDVFLAWSQGLTVYAAARPAGGSFEPSEFFIHCTGTCIAAGNPDIAADAGGNSIVVWTQGDIQAAMRPASGSFARLGSLSSGAAGTTPRIAFTSDGTAIAVWRQSDDVYAAVRPPGGAFGAPTPLHDAPPGQTTGSLRLATSGSGDALVGYVTNQTVGNTQTKALRTNLYTAGSWFPAQTAVEATYPTSAPDCNRDFELTDPDIAMDASGNAVAAAVEDKQTIPSSTCSYEESSKILAARRSKVGGSWTLPQAVDSAPSFTVLFSPSLTFTSNGEAVAAWAGIGGPLRYSAAAPPPTSPFAGAQDVPDTSGATQPDLAPLADGATMLVFEPNQNVAYAIRPAGGDFGPSDEASASISNFILSGLRTAADPAGDVAAAWIQPDGAGDSRLRWLAYDASPPTMGQVSVPATGAPGQELAMRASATDAFSPFSLAWTFGDGASAAGPQVSHAYGTPGSFTPAVTAFDGAGNSASVTRTVAIGGPDRRAPSFLGPLTLDNRTLAAAARGGSVRSAQRRRRAPVGTRVRFRLDEAARVAFTVARAQAGRRVGRRCVKPTRRNRKSRRCTRFARQRGGFTVAAAQGQTRFRFMGRLRNRKLRPGRYRLIAVAQDASGNRSSPRRAAFRIVRR